LELTLLVGIVLSISGVLPPRSDQKITSPETFSMLYGTCCSSL